MKKLRLSLLIVFAFFSFSIAAAAVFPNDGDARVQSTGGNENNNFGMEDILWAEESCLNGNQTQISYIRFNLDTIVDEISSASATSNLTISGVTSFGTGQINLYTVSDDSWTENGITYTNRPSLSGETILASVPVSGTVGTVEFSSAALVNYLNEQSSATSGGDTVAGDDTASFAIGIQGCSGPNALIVFESRDDIDGTGPVLNLFDPTAVHLGRVESSAGRDDRLVWLLAALGLGLAGSLLLVQRVKKHG